MYRGTGFVFEIPHRTHVQRVALLVGLPSLTFPGVQQLKYPGDIFGIGPDNVTLRDRTHVEHFAERDETVLSEQLSSATFYQRSRTIPGSVFCLSFSES